MICRHCKERKANRPRGTCWRCYYTPGVKELYPSTSKYANRGLNGAGFRIPEEPTDAEPGSAEKLAVIAERIACGVSCDHPDDRKEWHVGRGNVAGEPHKCVLYSPISDGRESFASSGSYDTERFDRPEQR